MLSLKQLLVMRISQFVPCSCSPAGISDEKHNLTVRVSVATGVTPSLAVDLLKEMAARMLSKSLVFTVAAV